MTLTLADVARLAQVERPVVSMWRQRTLAGHPFPTALPDDTFEPDEIVGWLEATGRGNNPSPRVDLAITAATRRSSAEELDRLLALVALRTLLDEPISQMSRDDLLDAADSLDPEDAYLFREIESIPDIESLVEQVDELTATSWYPGETYERLLDARQSRRPDQDLRLSRPLLQLLSSVVASMMTSPGRLLDVDGTAADIVVEIQRNEDLPTANVALPHRGESPREARRRYLVHHSSALPLPLDDDWPMDAGSVAVAHLPTMAEAALDLLNELSLQLRPGTFAIVVGPATVLTDPLPAAQTTVRDQLLRANLVRAAVRLPQGLTRGGTRHHLALWLMGHAGKAGLWAADLSGTALTRDTSQHLLDDLLAVSGDPHGRAFKLLRPAKPAVIVATGGSLVSSQGTTRNPMMTSPADDAIRIHELHRALTAALPDPSPFALALGLHQEPRAVTLEQAIERKWATLIPGTRIDITASGSTRLWTAETLTAGSPRTVNLFELTRQHPTLRLTEPGDLIIQTHGKPTAVVDAAGGSAVAYPARVLRLNSPRLVAGAIAHAINALPAGNGKWRSWQVPIASGEQELAAQLFSAIDDYESQLWERQTLLKELRQVASRSVLPGSLTLTPLPADEKGQ